MEYFPGEVSMDDFCNSGIAELASMRFYTVYVFTDDEAVETYGDEIASSLAEFKVNIRFSGEITEIYRRNEKVFELIQ